MEHSTHPSESQVRLLVPNEGNIRTCTFVPRTRSSVNVEGWEDCFPEPMKECRRSEKRQKYNAWFRNNNLDWRETTSVVVWNDICPVRRHLLLYETISFHSRCKSLVVVWTEIRHSVRQYVRVWADIFVILFHIFKTYTFSGAMWFRQKIIGGSR